jgi:hypothetical protein
MKKVLFSFTAMLLVGSSLSFAQTTNITVVNPGFELPDSGKVKGWDGKCADPGWTGQLEDIPGWRTDALDSADFDSGVELDSHLGKYRGYLMARDTSMYQVLSYRIATGDIIQLTVDVLNTWQANKIKMQLFYLNGDTARVSIVSEVKAITGSWAEYSISFNAADVPESIGWEIGILFDNVSDSSSSWLGIDNVRLTSQQSFIVVDGIKDPFYSSLTGPNDGYLQIKSYAVSTNGNPVNDADLSAKVWAAWDSTWFYLYEEVMDDTVKGTGANNYQDDCIELKFDPQPKDSVVNSIFAVNLTALGKGTAGVVSADSLTPVPDSMKQWVRKIIPGGYALELAIKWPAIKSSNNELVSVAVDSVFGFAINNHDNDATTRQASIIWAAVMDDHVWDTPKDLGTVKFLSGNKLKFIPTNTMTGVTNKTPYDGTPFYMNIDAKKDPFYTFLKGPSTGYLQIRSSSYSDNGAPKNDADLSAKVWTAWDPTWFYLYEEVMDDTVKGTGANNYQDDCIELKFDPQPKDSVTNSIFGVNLTALGKGTAGVVSADSLTGVADSMKQWSRRIIPGGYALELAIKWPAIKSSNGEVVSVAVDSVFGLGINNHDNDATTRQASIIWAAFKLDAIWNTPKYLGTVKFLAGNKLQFTTKNKMTGRSGNTDKYDGTDAPMSVERIEGSIPKEFSLDQNYPNPFNPSTTISFSIPAVSQVRLVVYDILGREVKTLLDEKKEAGSYRVTFNAQNFASGIYFCRIEAGAEFKVRKMMLLK